MQILVKINGYLKKLEVFTLAFVVLFMAALLISNVLSRSVFNFSLTFAEELGSFLMIALTYIGSVFAVRRCKHIRMTAFVEILSEKGQKYLGYFTNLVTGSAFIYVGYLSFEYLMMVKSLDRIAPVLGVPMWIPLIPMVAGLFFTGLQYILIIAYNLIDKDKATWIGTERKLGESEEETDASF